MKLKTETNTPAIERRVLHAARLILRKRNLSAFFEHGQWWVDHWPTGDQWSVVDAEGGSAVDGFYFEQVTKAEETGS